MSRAPRHPLAKGRDDPSGMTLHVPTAMRRGARHASKPVCYSLDTCRRILLDRAVPYLLRAKHWYSPSYSSGRPPLRKSITRVPDRLLIDTRGSLAMLKYLLFRVQWKLWAVWGGGRSRGNKEEHSGLRAPGENLRALVPGPVPKPLLHVPLARWQNWLGSRIKCRVPGQSHR